MARSVADVALFLSAIAGPDPRSPLAIHEDGARFAAPLDAHFKGVRVAWWKGLGGIPVRAGDPRRGRREPAGLRGARLQSSRRPSPTSPASPRRSRRCATSANYAQYAPLVRERPEWVKDTIKYEVAEAERLTGADIGRALGAAGADVRRRAGSSSSATTTSCCR